MVGHSRDSSALPRKLPAWRSPAAHPTGPAAPGRRCVRPLGQTKLRLAVATAYYAMYHALARSNADLLVGPSETGATRRNGTVST